MNNIQNVFGAILLNGTLMYHTHRLRAYHEWKSKNSSQIISWLEVIGEMETFHSLSNFAYNNPNFCFPILNQNFELEFEELGHPLIGDSKRVCNDISFQEKPFTILII